MQDTPQQIAVYNWVENPNPVKRNLTIKAGAGSGKSTTAVKAMKRAKGKIKMMAFGSKAAKELEHKLSSMGLSNIDASTFHQAGKRMLYKAFGYHTVNNSKVFYITEKFCQSEELTYARNFISKLVGYAKQNAFGVKGETSIDNTQAWMDVISHHDMVLEADVDFLTVIEIAKLVLLESNKDLKCIDFDDMQYLPLIYDVDCEKYDWVVIDEAQDTNSCRKLIAVKIIKPDTGRLIAIGDDFQAIMGFAGAENNSLDLIAERFDCESLPLSVSFRCAKNIIKEAQKYCPDAEAFEGNIDGVVSSMAYQEFIDNALNIKLDKSVGILCRNNAPNVALAFALIRQGIGCRIEGREIGNDLKTLVRKWKRVKNLDEFTIKLTDFFTKEFEKKANYTKLQLLEDKLDTMIILIERVQTLGKNDLKSLEDLITSMFTNSDDKYVPNVVTLSSIHKAKGLEWDTTYILGIDQFSPSKYSTQEWQLEQEKNLSYVAVTRAKNELVYLNDCPTRRNKEDN